MKWKIFILVFLLLLITISFIIIKKDENVKEDISFLLYSQSSDLSFFSDRDNNTGDVINSTVNSTNRSIRSPSRVIGSSATEWDFEVTNEDDVKIEWVRRFNDSHFCWNSTPLNFTKLRRAGYDGKIRMDNTTLRSNLNEQSLTGVDCLPLPTDRKSFTLRIGENSTLISASNFDDALEERHSEHYCTSTNGTKHIIFMGQSGFTENITYQKRDEDNNLIHTRVLAEDGSAFGSGIVCLNNGSIFTYWIGNSPNDVVGMYLTDDGNDNSTSFTAMDRGGDAVFFVDANAGSDSCIKMVASFQTDDNLYYTNCTQWNTEVSIQSNSNDDGDVAAVGVTSDGTEVVIFTGSDQDDLDGLIGGVTGWGDSNKFEIHAGSSYSTTNNLDLAISNISGTEMIYTCDTIGQNLNVCNFSVGNLNPLCSLDITNGRVDQCNVGIADDGEVIVVAWNSTFLNKHNSSDNVNWETNAIQSFDTSRTFEYPSIGTDYFPEENRMLKSNGNFSYLYLNSSGIDPRLIYLDYVTLSVPPSGDDSCTYSSGNWDIDCSDECVISSANNIGGNNIIMSGSGVITVTGNITNYAEFHVKQGCKVNCYGGCQIT